MNKKFIVVDDGKKEVERELTLTQEKLSKISATEEDVKNA